MSLEIIKKFVSKINAKDLQSFENDLSQFWNLLNRFDKVINVCKSIENKYNELNQSVVKFYDTINKLPERKPVEDKIREIVVNNPESKTALGYFLLKEEVKQNTVGYQRVIRYWYPEYSHAINYQAKKSFTEYIIKPLVELIESKINTI